MPAKVVVGAVIALVVLVGGLFVLIAVLNNSDAGSGSQPSQGAPRLERVTIVRGHDAVRTLAGCQFPSHAEPGVC